MVYLLRHGDAEEGEGDDAARRLTAKGEHQAIAAGRALAALGAEIEAGLSSPKVRAAQTARLACKELGIDFEESSQLAGGRFDPLELAAGRIGILLVGHEPDFSTEAGLLTGAKLKLRKGGVIVIDDNTLIALLRPRDLRLIAEHSPPEKRRSRA